LPEGQLGGLPLGKQLPFVSDEIVPLLSHPHVTVEVTDKPPVLCPLL